jgi:hypothetical protein
MSIVSTIYPDPRRSLARESARCRRSPLPRRSLPVDVVDDRCDPSVFELTRLDPRRRAPAKADSLLSGFGLLPVRNPNICPGAKNGFWIESRIAPPMRLCHTEEPTESSMPCVHAETNRGVEPRRLKSPLVSILRSSRSDGSLKGFRSLPLESLTLRSLPSMVAPAVYWSFPVKVLSSVARQSMRFGRLVDLAWCRHSK